ncbi:hypothetical protein FSP39_014636 [Pinctada imbricata]|uniref:Vwde helical domain-containing protein n=1 Tax=Pinctada imbricata TaxID=66713 RepID=A0AA88YAZ8_PINIB|nr:hypothetical protein FSP39_014636 [Pinctada imbricata]
MFGFTGEDDYKRRNGTWTKTHSVTICHKDDGSFDKTDTDFTIYFLTDRVYAENVWNNAKSPSTKVRVSEPLDNQWQSRYCYDLLDPHLRTFDGSHYQSHENGKYLLYRNNKTMQEVHVKHRPCFGSVSDPYCLCGVAARAGRDVFVINICDRNNLMEYTLCDDGALSVTKTSERYYNGCVSMVSTIWDDSSIRVLSSVEDLFNENAYSRLSRLQTKKFCSCSSNNEEKCNFENQQITSKYSERKITCALYSNGLNRRKKRSVSSRLQGISQDDSPYNLERHKRSSGINTSITEKMSEDEAKSYCELTMNSSTAYSECLSTIDVLDQSYIDSCTEDLKVNFMYLSFISWNFNGVNELEKYLHQELRYKRTCF